MIWLFGKRSLACLDTVDADLQRVTLRALALSPYDFGVLCGVRTFAEQQRLVAKGLSQTTYGRHLPNDKGESEAIDIGVYINGKYINGDTPDEQGYYRKVLQAFVTAAIEEGVQIELGGLWRTFIDTGHIQLKQRKK